MGSKYKHEYEIVRVAMDFMMTAHKDQKRDGTGLPYAVHPIAVFSTVKKFKESKNILFILVAALLHDVVEDCNVSLDTIRALFGSMVASIVEELTNDEVEKNRLGKEVYISQKLIKLSNYALVIKLADILDNLSDRPSEGMLTRIYNNLSYLAANRSLTGTQSRIFAEINGVLVDYGKKAVELV